MEKLNVFTVRELRQRTGDLLRNAEDGHIALITKHGRPAFLALPFDESLLKFGINKTLALHLFQAGHITLSQAARIAIISIEELLDLLGELEIPAVDYPPEELLDLLGELEIPAVDYPPEEVDEEIGVKL